MTQDEMLKLTDKARHEGWEGLDLNDKGQKELPPAIGNLTRLKRLDLDSRLRFRNQEAHNQCITVSAQIWQLSNLSNLVFRSNQLPESPPKSGNCTISENRYLIPTI